MCEHRWGRDAAFDFAQSQLVGKTFHEEVRWAGKYLQTLLRTCYTELEHQQGVCALTARAVVLQKLPECCTVLIMVLDMYNFAGQRVVLRVSLSEVSVHGASLIKPPCSSA